MIERAYPFRRCQSESSEPSDYRADEYPQWETDNATGDALIERSVNIVKNIQQVAADRNEQRGS